MTLSIRTACAAFLVAAVTVLTGCGSAPSRGGNAGGVPVRPGPAPSGDRDGPEANPPADLSSVPDAEPKIEPIRTGGPNKPYEVQGRDYRPITEDRPFSERGLASWYGKKFHGRRTASGEIYNMYAMTAAHPTLPIPSYVRVRNPANDREVVVRINDRGPFHSNRIIDLSYTAALKLGLLKGVAPVELSRITFDDIRTGSWRRDAAVPDGNATAVAAREPAARRTSAALKPAAAAEQEPSANVPAVTALVPSASLPSVALPASAVATTTTAASSPGTPAATQVTTASAAPATVLGQATPTTPSTTTTIAAAPSVSTDAPRGDAIVSAANARPAPGFWVQLGVFRQRDGADGFHRRVIADLDWLAPLLAVFGDSGTYRLQAGPYASRDQAQDAARRVREALSLVPVIVERR